MEKENVNQKKQFGEYNTILTDRKVGAGATEETSHNATLPELFNLYIKAGIATFKRDGKMMAVCFLICRDFKKEEYQVGIYPMPNGRPEDMQIHSQIIRRVIKQLKVTETNDFKLVGVIIGMDAFMSFQTTKVLNSDGTFDKNKYVEPRDDPNAKDVLNFTLEDAFSKHTKTFEYVKSNTGVVVNEVPYIDQKTPYNEMADKNSNFGFLFAEKVGQN